MKVLEKLGFSGFQKWVLLGLLSGYLAIPISSYYDEAQTANIMLIYLCFMVAICVGAFVKVLVGVAGISVIRANIDKTPETEEEDVILEVEYAVDLQIELQTVIPDFEDYIQFEKRVVNEVSKLIKQKCETISKKYTILLKEAKEGSPEADRILADQKREMKEVEKWIHDEFKSDIDPTKPVIELTLHAYWTKLQNQLSFEESPDVAWDKVVIITRRPWEQEFEFRKKEEFIGGYWVKCKASRAEMIRFPSIIDEIPVLYSSYTQADKKKTIKVALEAQSITTIEIRSMRQMLDSYKMQFNDLFTIKQQYEGRIAELKQAKEDAEQQLIVANRNRINNLTQKAVIIKNSAWIYLLGIWSIISLILLYIIR